MVGSYEEVIGPLLQTADPDLEQFAEAAKAHFEAAYRETFGLGEAVANRRAELRLSQIQLAKRTGVRQADISRIEQGKGNPTLDTIRKILSALQLQIMIKAQSEHWLPIHDGLLPEMPAETDIGTPILR